MLRMFRGSSGLAAGREYAKLKAYRFMAFMLSPSLTQTCLEWHPSPSSEVARKTLSKGPLRPDPSTKVVRIIVPFRRELIGLPSEFNRLCELWRPWLQGETGKVFDFKMSWASAGRNLRSLLRYY